MAGIAEGTPGTYHSEHGDVPAWVVEYKAGRDSGDHYVAGFSLPGEMAHVNGPTFGHWTQIGSKQGQFSPS